MAGEMSLSKPFLKETKTVTFTQVNLKDVAWTDSEPFHLGLVVIAQ